MITTQHEIQGKLTLRKYDVQGDLVEQKVAHNSITKAGRQLVSNLFKFNILDTKEDKIKRISMIHLGSSQTNFDANHVSLQDYVGHTKIKTVEVVPRNDDRITLRLVGELDEETCNGELREAGLFTEDETPVMYNRVTFDTITKSQEFKLTLIWELTF